MSGAESAICIRDLIQYLQNKNQYEQVKECWSDYE